MAFNHGQIPTSPNGNVVNMINLPGQQIPTSPMYTGNPPYIPGANGAGIQETAAAHQMAQLSLATVQQHHHHQQQQQQEQQPIYINPALFPGQIQTQPSNGHLSTSQQPTSLPIMQQTINQGPHPSVVMQNPVSVNPLYTSTQVTAQGPAPHLLTSHTSGALLNTSAPFYMHGAQFPNQISPPDQQQQPQPQQMFVYEQQQAIAAQPPQHLPITSTIGGDPYPTQLQGNVAVTPPDQIQTLSPDMTDYGQIQRPQLNALPHSMPTTLNASLQRRRSSSSSASGDITSACGDVLPTRGGSLYQPWNQTPVFEDASPSETISSPPGWANQVLPVYEIPLEKDICLRCLKRVYVVERVGPIKEALYHKNCFTCAACKTKLTMKNFHHNPNDMDDVNIYCASHKPRTKNISSEANAYYIKTSPRGPSTIQIEASQVSNSTQDCHPAVYDTVDAGNEIMVPHIDVRNEHIVSEAPHRNQEIVTHPDTILDTQSQEIVSETFSRNEEIVSDANTHNQGHVTVTVVSTGRIASGSQKSLLPQERLPESNTESPPVETPETPPQRRPSIESTGGSSTYSTISSASSIAVGMKTDSQTQTNPTFDQPDMRSSLVRSDRPSSTSSSAMSLEIIPKPEPNNIKPPTDGVGIESQRRVPLIMSSTLERQDRPSSNIYHPDSKPESRFKQRDPASRMVKSNSSHEFPTGNNPSTNQTDQYRSLPSNDSRRKDRPSQY